ncbi:Hypothetical protein CINCED_3A016747 [Cinara cedri]|nr:Hypothetical protein CINCED_3A016747 [Cinara cedri]
MECAGRFLCGLSLGATTVAVPLYASDVSSDVLRGRTGVFLDFMLCAGIEYAYVARTVVSGLRRFCAWSAAVPLVFVLLFSYMPESPIYLFNEGRHKEAATALRWLRGRRFDVQKEFDRIEKSRWNDDMAKGINVMNGKNNRKFLKKVLIISFGLVLAQRLSGAGGVIQYSNTLFKLSGAAIEPSTACIIVGAFQVAASGLSFLLIDKVGRRTLLLISSGLVTVCLALLIFYFGLLERNLLPTDSPWKMTVLLVLCTFISAFRLGLGPIPWFISIELMPDAYRDRIQSVTASFSWFLSFVIMKTFKVLVESHPVEVWCSYAAFSAVGFVFILACVPETNNKSNEQILSDLTD